ncbi:hypothetical protein Tco_0053103 [Tanacetum coccineum]
MVDSFALGNFPDLGLYEGFFAHIILTGIDNDIYSIGDACPNEWRCGKQLKEEAGIQLSAEQVDWRDDTDDEHKDQELEAHYMYMEKIQEVTPDAADNFGPIFDAEPVQKVHNCNDDYNVFANDKQHPEQHESINDTYLMEQCDTNITYDSSDMSNNSEEADQDEQMLQKRTLENELSKRNTTSKSFEILQQHAINLELALQQCQEQIKNDKAWKQKESSSFQELNDKFFKIQDLKAQLQDKNIAIRVIFITIVSRPHLKSNQLDDRVLHNNSQVKKITVNLCELLRLGKKDLNLRECLDQLGSFGIYSFSSSGDSELDVSLDMLASSEYLSDMARASLAEYKIPRDLHPRLPSEEFVMSKLSDDVIGVYHHIFDFSGVRIPFSLFLLALIKHCKVYFSQLGPLGLNKVVTFEVLCRSLQIKPTMTLFRVFQTLCKQGHWFSFANRHALSPVCIDGNRSCMKHWKSGFFLIDRRAIPDYMSWRHPNSAINDPKPLAGSFNMEDV